MSDSRFSVWAGVCAAKGGEWCTSVPAYQHFPKTYMCVRAGEFIESAGTPVRWYTFGHEKNGNDLRTTCGNVTGDPRKTREKYAAE